MGYEIVRGFAQSSAKAIAMIDINDELGAKVHQELQAEFPDVKFKYYHLNISEYEEVREQRQEQTSVDFVRRTHAQGIVGTKGVRRNR